MNKNTEVTVIVAVGVIGMVLFLARGSGEPEVTVTEDNVSAKVEEKVDAEKDDAAMEGVVEVTVEASNFKFSQETITVKAGQKVKLTFKNTGGFHDVVIDELGVKTARINGGEEEVVEFVAAEAGEYAYYCSVPGHRQQGMEGMLIVE